MSLINTTTNQRTGLHTHSTMEDLKQQQQQPTRLTGHKRRLNNSEFSLCKRFKSLNVEVKFAPAHSDLKVHADDHNHNHNYSNDDDDVLGPEVKFESLDEVTCFVGEGKEREDVFEDMLWQALPCLEIDSEIMRFAASFCADPSHSSPHMERDQGYADDLLVNAADNAYCYNDIQSFCLDRLQISLTLAKIKLRKIFNHLGLTRLEQELDQLTSKYLPHEGLTDKIKQMAFRIKNELKKDRKKTYKRLHVVLAVVSYVLMWAFVERRTMKRN